MAFLKKTAQMTFLKKKHDQKHSVMQSLGAIALMEAMYCTQLCYFFFVKHRFATCYQLYCTRNKRELDGMMVPGTGFGWSYYSLS